MITEKMVRSSIEGFLSEMLEKRRIERNKEINGLLASGLSNDDPKVLIAIEKLEAVELAYEYDNWLKNAAERMVHHVTLATHISKGVHSMSRGDSVLFCNKDDMPAHLVGSHNTPSATLDISGSAGALPLYNFINTKVADDVTIKDLIESGDAAFLGALSPLKRISKPYLKAFRAFLNQVIDAPATSNLNKQMLFPINGEDFNTDDIDALEYVNIVPLYASVFCHEIKTKVNAIRFSEVNKGRASNRFSASADELEQEPYQTIRDLAVLKLGGSKPANISKVVVMAGGETLLLPSLPPIVSTVDKFELPIQTNSLFDTAAFNRLTAPAVNAFASAYVNYSYQANHINKNERINALHFLLITIFDLAVELRNRKAGWLINHKLDINEKYWLDPKYGLLEGQSSYHMTRTVTGWEKVVLDRIAAFINTKLHSKLIKNANEFNELTFEEWRKEAQVIANKYKTNGNEVLV